MIEQTDTVTNLWNEYNYCDLYKKQFTASECESIIDLHRRHGIVSSKMSSATGLTLRNSDLFWIPHVACTDWIFRRVWGIVTLYNSKYGVNLSEDMRQSQLTRYMPGQHYDWHMDLGPGQMSSRKITAVVQLTPQEPINGAGLEVFYSEAINNRINLDTGDVVMFPSFIMHRASVVQSGARWSLVFWLNGTSPLR
jgi:hypothetical protein